MKTKVFSLILIALIVTSSLGMANAEFGTFGLPDAKKTEITTTPSEKIITVNTSHQPAKIEVDLSESVGITTNDNPNNNQAQKEISNSVNKLSLVTTEIDLSENFAIYDNLPGKNAFLALKQSSDAVTTMERISNSDRIRFNGRSIVINDGLSDDNKIYDKLISFLENPELSLTKASHNIENNFGKINEDLLHYMSPIYISVAQKSVYQFSGEITAVKNFVLATTHDSVHGKNPTIFLLLVPLSGYILI
ncbi:MAG: hypothetical protein KGL95_08645, partial [Patescibacteria group bacterium]|nr:hypothetical protein [Patescibacteria group bacterium]